jgi:nitrogen fixation NifU-like protein
MNLLYQQKIMDHYHFPRHKGILSGECLVSRQSNPSCGDHVTIAVSFKDNVVQQAKFSGTGCILSLAAADMLLDVIIGKSIDEIKQITSDDIKKMVGIDVGHTRIKCILLPLQAVQHLYA